MPSYAIRMSNNTGQVLAGLLFKPFRKTNLQLERNPPPNPKHIQGLCCHINIRWHRKINFYDASFKKKNAQNYVRQQTAWSSAKTPTRLQNEQRKPLPLIFIFRLSFTWSLVALAQNSLENLSSWLQSEWNEAANIQDLRAIIFFQGTIITQDWVHMVLFSYSSALREVVCFVIGCL